MQPPQPVNTPTPAPIGTPTPSPGTEYNYVSVFSDAASFSTIDFMDVFPEAEQKQIPLSALRPEISREEVEEEAEVSLIPYGMARNFLGYGFQICQFSTEKGRKNKTSRAMGGRSAECEECKKAVSHRRK